MTTHWKYMVKRVLAIALGISVAAVMWLLYVLGVTFGLWQPLTRPAGVAASAHYVSQVEDGTWFDCTVDDHRNVDHCQAWDYSGRLIAQGDFRLEGEDRAASKAELRPSSVASSGGHAYAIYLFGKAGARSKTLVPIDARHPHTNGCKWDTSANRLSCD
jgi:hypothetical protein